jgi:hypothetical protein
MACTPEPTAFTGDAASSRSVHSVDPDSGPSVAGGGCVSGTHASLQRATPSSHRWAVAALRFGSTARAMPTMSTRFAKQERELEGASIKWDKSQTPRMLAAYRRQTTPKIVRIADGAPSCFPRHRPTSRRSPRLIHPREA